jgi:hypothetical protein
VTGKTYDDDQLHPEGVTGRDVIPDTHDHTDLNVAARRPGHGETVYLPGEGFLISHGGWSSRSKGSLYAIKSEKLRAGRAKGMPDEGTFLTEEEILSYAASIKAHRRMTGAKGAKARAFEEARSRCHPGTDAVDGAKDGLHSSSDEFELDRSRSTIRIGVSTCGPPGMQLNGSKVYHHNVVCIDLSTPDGRQLCMAYMSPEQFASALFSNSSAPCTLARYWSIDEDSVQLTERVRPPESIRKRMEKRIKHRMKEQRDAIREIVEELTEQAASGKPARKTQLKDLAERLARACEYFAGNAAFTVDQAREEITSIMESAAIQFVGQQNLDARTLYAAAGPALAMDDDDLGDDFPEDAPHDELDNATRPGCDS